jgi:hypothetical protein
MLLYVQRCMTVSHDPPLGGDTYTIIPKLLVPRLLWPGKPRTHEGQVQLNTHFRLQSERETWTTYIAWGLLAEAYANFGPIMGPLFLGAVLGLVLTSIEVWSGNYPLMSLRGAIAAAVMLQTINSYEMTAAIYVTSTGQLLVTVLAAMIVLSRRHRMVRAR